MIAVLPELDEVEGIPTRGEVKEVNAEDYDLPLARAIRAIQYNEELASKLWLDEGLEEALTLLDLSDENNDILRSRDLERLQKALQKEQIAAGVPEGMHIVWALVRI